MRSLALSLLLLAACGSDDDPGDRPAPVGRCAPEVTFDGEHLDLAAIGGFTAIGGAVWTVDGDPARTATSAPNGRVELCLQPGVRSRITVAAPGDYLDGHYTTDADVWAHGMPFTLYGATRAGLDALYATFEAGLAVDPAKAQLLVEIRGTPGTVTLAGTAATAVRHHSAGAWTAAGPGTYALFVNVDPGTGTVSMPGADGGGPVVLEAGAWAMTTVQAP